MILCVARRYDLFADPSIIRIILVLKSESVGSRLMDVVRLVYAFLNF